MFKTLLLFVFLLTTSFCTNDTAKAVTNESSVEVPTSSNSSSSNVKIEDDNARHLLELVNQLRKKGCRCGRKRMKSAPPLKMNRLLNQAARSHANDMDLKDFFEHHGSNGSTFSERISKTGYDWQTVGENIFWGGVGIQEVFQGWKDSPGHCKNMMNKDFREMGFAKVGIYWVQDFGKAY